ncbi:MAG: cytochrome c-type biogenesis protein CcmH [Gemmatimonadaceae bacterium]|nr:cytochrome c-type biogenesis protein CcmH [Gemmatimonadaceae bacterium]
MTNTRTLSRTLVGVAVVLTLASGVARAQAPELPAAPQGAPQDSGALRVKVQGTLTDAQKNDPVLDAATSEVAALLRCPVCQGVAIQDSPSELAQQMRMVVKEQLASGKSADEVKDYFVSKYGEWILLEPQAHGFNIVIYALPVLLVLGGAVFLVFIVRKWTAAAPAAAGGAPRMNGGE